MSGFHQPTLGAGATRADLRRSVAPPRDEAARSLPADPIGPLETPVRTDTGPGAPDSPENLLHFARRRALRLVGRRAFTHDDVDDLVQEAYLGLLEAQRERGGRAPNERLVVDRVTKLASRWHLPADVRYESFAGRRVYLGLVDEFLQEHGRMPSKVEEDVIAEGVRTTWHDADHRPAPGFHRISLTPHASFDERWGAELGAEPAVADASEGVDAHAGERRAGDARDDAADALAAQLETDGSGAVERRRRAWSLFAGALGLPDAVPGSLGPRTVTAMKAVVKGRLARLASAYLVGESDEAETSALFAPFGDPTMTDRDRIAAALERHPDEAERLWTSAINAANRRGAVAR